MAPKQKLQLKIYGLLQSEKFHMARSCAEDLSLKYPEKFNKPIIKSMLECDWDHFIACKKIELKREVWSFSDPVMCFCNGKLTGNHTKLINWAKEAFNYEDFRPELLYSAMAEEAYREFFTKSEHSFTYLDIAIDGKEVGRLLFELFTDVCPKTCENFRSLCTGEKGMLPSGLVMNYLHTPIHRVVPNGWIQGGDILHGRGDSGESIFGEVFEDETYAIRHDRRGVLGMANKGRHTNASQFYVTLQPTPWMDCQYVAFGDTDPKRFGCDEKAHVFSRTGDKQYFAKEERVLVEGTKLLGMLENLPTFNERPRSDVKIAACGEFIPEQ